MSRFARLMEKITTVRRRKRLPADDTRSWVTMATAGMLDPGNLYLFDYCMRRLKPGAVVEIGSFCGLSLNHLLLLLRQHARSNAVFSADAWEFEGFSKSAACLDDTQIPAAPYRTHIMESFRRNIGLFNGMALPHHIQANSDDFFAAWSRNERMTDFFGNTAMLGGPIALAYIDGDHSYEQSRRDFENVDRFIVPGGFIIFDDSADWTDWGSQRTAREVAARPDYELVDRAPNYCLRKRG